MQRFSKQTPIDRRFRAAQGCAAGIDHRRWLIPKQAANPLASAKPCSTLQRRVRRESQDGFIQRFPERRRAAATRARTRCQRPEIASPFGVRNDEVAVVIADHRGGG